MSSSGKLRSARASGAIVELEKIVSMSEEVKRHERSEVFGSTNVRKDFCQFLVRRQNRTARYRAVQFLLLQRR